MPNWYIHNGNEKAGPFTEEDILSKIKGRTLSATDKVSVDGTPPVRLGTTTLWRNANMPSYAAKAASVADSVTTEADTVRHNKSSAVTAENNCPPRKKCRIKYLIGAAVLLIIAAAVVVSIPRAEKTDDSHVKGVRASLGVGKMKPMVATKASESDNSEYSIDRYFTPNKNEVYEIFNKVRNSKAVRENRHYNQIAKSINCRLTDDDVVNAYATWHTEESGARHRLINYTSGHVMLDKIVGAVLAKYVVIMQNSPGDGETDALLSGICTIIPQYFAKYGVKLSKKEAKAIVKEFGITDDAFRDKNFCEIAIALGQGECLSTLSHEMGHHVLGHMDERHSSEGEVLSRAQEEQADAFITSVMSLSDSDQKKQIFLGRFMWSLIMAIKDSATGVTSDEDKTHPLTRKRLRNLLEADPALAREFGFTEEGIDSLIVKLKGE